MTMNKDLLLDKMHEECGVFGIYSPKNDIKVSLIQINIHPQ